MRALKTWKVDEVPTLPELPAEVDDELQQQQAHAQEQQQAEEPQRPELVHVCVRLPDGLTKQQGHVSPGAAQHLHQACARQGKGGEQTHFWPTSDPLLHSEKSQNFLRGYGWLTGRLWQRLSSSEGRLFSLFRCLTVCVVLFPLTDADTAVDEVDFVLFQLLNLVIAKED